MEIKVQQTELLKELQLLQGIVERKNTIPILANVMVEADDGAHEIRLAATDLEVGLRGRCPATIVRGGSLTLPARKLYEIARALPDTEKTHRPNRPLVEVLGAAHDADDDGDNACLICHL